MFCHIINWFLTRTRNIVHFAVTLKMLFTYLHAVFCVYMYIQLYTIIHTYTYNIYTCLYTDIHIYIYILIHAYTCLPTYMYIILALYLFTYVYIPLVLTCKHKYIYTYIYAYPYMYTIIHTWAEYELCMYKMYIHSLLYTYAFWLSSVYPSWSRFRSLYSLRFCLPESGWHF